MSRDLPDSNNPLIGEAAISVQFERILALNPDPPWLSNVCARLQELLQLPENWDTYGGRKIDIDVIGDTVALLLNLFSEMAELPEPQIVPTSNGSLQLEWVSENRDIELLRVGDRKWELFAEDSQTGEETELLIESNLRPVLKLLQL